MAIQTAKIQKQGNKWRVILGTTAEEFDNAEQAMERANQLNEAQEAAAAAEETAVLRFRENTSDSAMRGGGGKLDVYFGDQSKLGRFPAISLYRDQYEVLIANWPMVVEHFKTVAPKLGTVAQALKAPRVSK